MRTLRLESLAGVSGTLVSAHFALRHLEADFAGQLGEDSRGPARRIVLDWTRRGATRLGPASSLSTIASTGARPVFAALGFNLRETDAGRQSRSRVDVAASHAVDVPVVIVPWGDNMDRHWTAVARAAARGASEWAFCFNGRAIRLCDASRAWARRCLEFDLAGVSASPVAFGLLWALLRPGALSGLTRRAADRSTQLGLAVCASLESGVRDALGWLMMALATACRRRGQPAGDRQFADALFDQALTVIYRILFLLFAESRTLVPMWHPVYRSSYTIESLRIQAERPGRPTGVWEGLQAMSRLAHAGCRAGSLTVTPFNGRLFAPARAPLADTLRLDDALVARAIVALTTHPGARGRETISFRDLGVEQLGAVYERVLDYEPRVSRLAQRPEQPVSVELVCGRGRRKSSGTFYTPRLITDELVRQTLTPLVAGRAPEDILRLRVLDPAMGSGAFLVSACRFLSAAYEEALVSVRGRMAADITDAERAEFRRLVARRCLYGVDISPMAAQVARLSLWLATLAAERPLTFLDHHLAVGDSLVGASLDDLARQAPGRSGRRRGAVRLPLFDTDGWDAGVGRVLPVRRRLESVADDTVDAVRNKERWVADLASKQAPLGALKRAADLWCALWFWRQSEGQPPDAREYADLAAAVAGAEPALPARMIRDRLAAVDRIAARHGFFHWTLEFPEVFYGDDGVPLPAGGFDCIVGNPPWEMLRGDLGDDAQRECRRESSGQLTRFARESGVYPSCAHGHVNQFQLFVERSLDLVRPGGRVGLIVPWGLASDHGCADLRRRLFDDCNTDRLIGFDNTSAIFPIHRSIRFLLLSTTRGKATRRTRCRFGLRDAGDLEVSGVGRARSVRAARPVTLTRERLRRLSGSGLAVPHVRTDADLVLLERLSASFPRLADPNGWGVSFGRELNATDDRASFTEMPGLIPVVDGKHIDPFVVRLDDCRRWIRHPVEFAATRAGRASARRRIAYRDVAASTNRLTLIAAILPPQTAAVHTLFCLKTPLPMPAQRVLCAVLNSLVANYVVRMWVTTHLGTTTVERLPAPRPGEGSAEFSVIASLAGRLERPGPASGPAYVELQAVLMRLYGLTGREVTLVLESFPLLDPSLRGRIGEAWKKRED